MSNSRRLTAAWLTFSAAPARAKLPVSARAAKARSAPSEGIVRQSMRKPALQIRFFPDSRQTGDSVKNDEAIVRQPKEARPC